MFKSLQLIAIKKIATTLFDKMVRNAIEKQMQENMTSEKTIKMNATSSENNEIECNTTCCNSFEAIVKIVQELSEQDSANGKKCSFIKNSFERRIAIELCVYEEVSKTSFLLKKSSLFHECKTLAIFSGIVSTSKYQTLIELFRQIKENIWIHEISIHVIAGEMLFRKFRSWQSDEQIAIIIDLFKEEYKIKDSNIEKVYISCREEAEFNKLLLGYESFYEMYDYATSLYIIKVGNNKRK
jgi:hypothetical protein